MKLTELLQLAKLLPDDEPLEIHNKDNKNIRLYKKLNARFLISNDSDNLDLYITYELLFTDDSWYVYFNNFNSLATTIWSTKDFIKYIRNKLTSIRDEAETKSLEILKLSNKLDELDNQLPNT